MKNQAVGLASEIRRSPSVRLDKLHSGWVPVVWLTWHCHSLFQQYKQRKLCGTSVQNTVSSTGWPWSYARGHCPVKIGKDLPQTTAANLETHSVVEYYCMLSLTFRFPLMWTTAVLFLCLHVANLQQGTAVQGRLVIVPLGARDIHGQPRIVFASQRSFAASCTCTHVCAD